MGMNDLKERRLKLNYEIINRALDKIFDEEEFDYLEKADIVPCKVKVSGMFVEVETQEGIFTLPKPRNFKRFRGTQMFDLEHERLIPPNILKYTFSFNKEENMEETLRILQEYNGSLNNDGEKYPSKWGYVKVSS